MILTRPGVLLRLEGVVVVALALGVLIVSPGHALQRV